jgi:hypothetical protein
MGVESILAPFVQQAGYAPQLVLRLTDYVAAADRVAGKLWQTARQVAARFKVLLIVAFVAAVGGISS